MADWSIMNEYNGVLNNTKELEKVVRQCKSKWQRDLGKTLLCDNLRDCIMILQQNSFGKYNVGDIIPENMVKAVYKDGQLEYYEILG